MEQGDLGRAEQCHLDSLALLDEIGDPLLRAAVLRDLGIVAHARGNYPRAASLLEESKQIFTLQQDWLDVAYTWVRLGAVALAQGECANAEIHFETGLTAFRSMGYTRGIAFTLTQIARLAALLGNLHKAAQCYNESLRLYRILADRPHLALVLHNRGQVALLQSDLSLAAACFQEGITVYSELDDKRGSAACSGALSALQDESQRFDLTAKLLDPGTLLDATRVA